MIGDLLREAEHKMEQAVGHVGDEFATVRTGRANPQLLHRIQAEYYGALTPLLQLASISVPEPRMLVVQPYDKTAIGSIEKAIQQSDLGLNPSNDGNIVRIVMPELTEERRKDYVKIVKDKAEQARVAVRNVRRQAMTDLDKLKGEVGDDEIARAEKELEAATKQAVDGIDEALKKKEAELLEV